MSTIEASRSAKSKQSNSARPRKALKLKSLDKASQRPTDPETSVTEHHARTTKHDRVLMLLSRAKGASIPEMMDATGWQQHSVRGFLAGTVKKKLGYTLTSSKAEGEPRRYRIETTRGS